jgi:hypothetical protein
MKECIELNKHSTCQRRAWNSNMSKLLCNYGGSFQSCFYKPNFIHFNDIANDTIMYCGDIESTGEFKTKLKWIEEFGYDDFMTEGEIWHTAIIKDVVIDLEDVLEAAEENEEMYDGWYLDVINAIKDPVVEAGIKRLNEILSDYPTYIEDMLVKFN